MTKGQYKCICLIVGLLGINGSIYAQSLEEQARGKIAALEAMVSVAESNGVSTERERLTLRTADFFLDCANWDQAHVSANAKSFKQLPNFKADANSLAEGLADFERTEVIKILNDATERLGLILDGTYTRTSSHEITAMQRQRKPLRIYYSLANAISRKTYMEDVRANYESVFFEGIPLGFATASILKEQDPSSWEAIQVWKTERVTQAEFDALQAYLNRGGTVLIDDESVRENEYGQPHKVLQQGRGHLLRIDSLVEMNQKAMALMAMRDALPAIKVTETNEIGPKGCVWRCIQTEAGNQVLSLINLGKSTATVKLELRQATQGTACKDMINGIAVSSTPQLKPKELFFVEVMEAN